MPKKNALLARWQVLCNTLLDPCTELTVEEFAPLLAEYRKLLAHGHVFDLGTVALMTAPGTPACRQRGRW